MKLPHIDPIDIFGFTSSIITLVLGTYLFCISAHARDPLGQLAQFSDPLTTEFFSHLLQPNSQVSCCGSADGYWADDYDSMGDRYVAIITDDRVFPWRKDRKPGTRIEIPNERILHDRPNPTGHGWVFLSDQDYVYCYLPPAGL